MYKWTIACKPLFHSSYSYYTNASGLCSACLRKQFLTNLSVGRDDYIEIEKDDIVIKRDGIIPSIAFS